MLFGAFPFDFRYNACCLVFDYSDEYVATASSSGMNKKQLSTLENAVGCVFSKDGFVNIVWESSVESIEEVFEKASRLDDALKDIFSEIKAYKNNVALGENEIVSTGTLVSCGSDEAYVVIKGDTDGDGSVNAQDYL